MENLLPLLDNDYKYNKNKQIISSRSAGCVWPLLKRFAKLSGGQRAYFLCSSDIITEEEAGGNAQPTFHSSPASDFYILVLDFHSQ